MHLEPAHQKLLAGDGGESKRLAMEILVKAGAEVGAETLVPIVSAHVQADYANLHDSGVELYERFVGSGGKFAVPTTAGPASIDVGNWKSYGISAEFAAMQVRLFEAFHRLGGIGCWTSTPYQVCNFPKAGEIVAWAEPNSVLYANSVIGCRTNRAAAGVDLACAILGLTPRHGVLLDMERVAKVAFVAQSGSLSELDYGSLGFFVGGCAGARIPRLSGIPKEATSDDLKHLGAAAASAGPLAMIHYEGITREPNLPAKESRDRKVEGIEVSGSDLEAVEAGLNQTDDTPDLVALGTPHLSISELGTIARVLSGRKLKSGTSLYAYTSMQAYEMASRAGIRADIEAAGGVLFQGADADSSPLAQMGYNVVATNSASLAERLKAEGAVKVRYASLRSIIGEVST